MNIQGYGGRAGNLQNETLDVLRGLLPPDWSFEAWITYNLDVKPLQEKNCANPKCGRLFQPRAEGDDYCNERCDPLNKFKGLEVTRND